jgi:surface antigen
MNKMMVAAALAASVILAGCEGGVRQEHAGMAVGGALGGLLGSQIGGGTGQLAATAAGAVAGALIGGSVGRSMDEVDRMKHQRALETAPTGYTTSWSNPDSGDRYAVTPVRTYEQAGTACRDFTTEAWVDGQRQVVNGTACRQPDGTWRAV